MTVTPSLVYPTASSPTSADFTPTAIGNWCFAAQYSGDSSNSASSDTGTDACVLVVPLPPPPPLPTFVTQSSSSEITLGAAVTDTATVTGSPPLAPTGTVSFYVCGATSSATDCTSTANQVGSAVTVTPSLVYPTAVATSADFTPTTIGNWCFAAQYSGDSSNSASSDTGTDACVLVVPLPPPPPLPTFVTQSSSSEITRAPP